MDACPRLRLGGESNSDQASFSEATAVTLVAQPLTAYNLAINDLDTYFVAASTDAAPVWVRNDFPDGPGAPR